MAEPPERHLVSAPVLLTPRLCLRTFRDSDLDALAAMYGDATVTRYLPFGLRDREQSAAALAVYRKMWREHGYGFWVVETRDDQIMVGLCGFVAPGELGYAFAPAAWGRGMATEAGHACLRYGFERLGWETIGAGAQRENAASLRVMEKLGMRRAPNNQYDENGGVWFEVSRAERAPGTR